MNDTIKCNGHPEPVVFTLKRTITDSIFCKKTVVENRQADPFSIMTSRERDISSSFDFVNELPPTMINQKARKVISVPLYAEIRDLEVLVGPPFGLAEFCLPITSLERGLLGESQH